MCLSYVPLPIFRAADLGLRPIFHQPDAYTEAHPCISFLVCLDVTPENYNWMNEAGLNSRSVPERMSDIRVRCQKKWQYLP